MPGWTLNGGAQMTGNQGTGALAQHATGGFATGDILYYDSTGNAIDSGVLLSTVCFSNNANCPFVPTGQTITITPAATTSVACAFGGGPSCNSLRGTLSIVSASVTTGTIATLSWPSTTVGYVCTVTQNGGVASYGIGNSTPSPTGMTITSDVGTPIGTIYVNYSCRN